MKKLILSIIIAGFALTGAQAACDQNCWYVQANGSFGWHNNSKYGFNNGLNEERFNDRQTPGFGGSLAVGYIMNCWRLELEASHRENSSKSKRYTSNTSLMANAYYDIPVSDCVSLYLGAGAGISSVNGKINTFEGNIFSYTATERKGSLDTVAAGQLMAGITFALDDNWDLVAGYRLFATAKPTLGKFSDGTKIKMSKMPISNNVELGLRFKF